MMHHLRKLEFSPLVAILMIIVLATPVFAVLASKSLRAEQTRQQAIELTSLIQASLSQNAQKDRTQFVGLDPALAQHLDLVHRSATRHALRLENLFREGPRTNLIRLGLEGTFWETNAFLRDLEFVGFEISEVDLSAENSFSTSPDIRTRILVTSPRNLISDSFPAHTETTPKWRNPFSRLRPTRIEVEGKYYWALNAIHSLTGISSINGIETATIDGRDYVEGEVLGGRKITRIEPSRVWLSDDSRSFVLEFAAPLNSG